MEKSSGPRLSISLYCFSREIHGGEFSIPDAIRRVADLGAEGVEIVNTQHIEGFPKPTKEFIKMFRDEIAKYNLRLSSYGTYTDTGIRTNGTLTFDEMKDRLMFDLDLAEAMGFPLVRLGPNTPVDVFLNVLPVAEKKRIKVSIEIHPPLSVDHPWFSMLFDAVKTASSEYLGFCPDFSCWATKIPDIMIEYAVQLGLPEEPVRQIATAFNVGVSLQGIKDQAHAMGAPKEGDELIDLMYHIVVKGSPEHLAMIMPYVSHIHGKFWKMIDGEESAIPYKTLLKVVKDSGYKGYITSEFEGYVLAGISGVEQAREHQKMLRRYLE
jgi:sugar phosphate isomerase/epimerase